MKVFEVDVYASLDPGPTLSIVTPYVSMRFDVIPNVFLDLFMSLFLLVFQFWLRWYIFSTLIGISIVSKRVYQKCLISFSSRVTFIGSGEFDMLDFVVTLSMD